MNEIALSVSKHFYNKDNRAPDRNGSTLWAYGAFDNVRWSLQQIVRHVTAGYAICVAETTGNWRKGENFKSAQIMGVDFDNGPGVSELLKNPFVEEHAFLIYATPSSTDDAPRSRVLFRLGNPLSDSDPYRCLLRRLLLSFNADNIDEKVKDSVRIFYGSAGKRYLDAPSAVLPISVLEALPPHPSELTPAHSSIPIPTANGDHSRYVQTALDDELNQLSSTRSHRNDALNETAFGLGTLVGAPWSGLNRFDVEQALYGTALANGYVSKDGEGAARATIKSGLDAGSHQPRPEPDMNPAYQRPISVVAKNATTQPPEPPPPFQATWHTSVESMQRYRERLETARSDGKLPLPFPFKALHEFGGFCRVLAPGVMVGIVGMSGGMKTSFVETITDSWKQMDTNDVLWYGPEWNWEKMADRAVQRYGGANMTDVMMHELYLQEMARGVKVRDGHALPKRIYDESLRISHEIEKWAGMNHYIEQMDVDIDELLIGSAQRLADAKAMGRNIRIAVWDYLQLMDMRSARSEQERITTILGRLKAFCVENGLIGVVASQVTKSASADTKENQKLLTSEAGQFFRGDKFNLVLTLNPIYDGKLLTDKGYINVDKNSIGRTGAVEVFIKPSHLKWMDSVEHGATP